MAKTFKVSFYGVDIDERHTKRSLMYEIYNIRYIYPQQLHIVESRKYDWHDKAPENLVNCDLADLESRFEHDTSDAGADDVVIGGIYQHFKGHQVKVIAISTGTEYGEKVVVYEHCENHTVWHRPLSMFVSEVDHAKYPDVKQKMRFMYVGGGPNENG